MTSGLLILIKDIISLKDLKSCDKTVNMFLGRAD